MSNQRYKIVEGSQTSHCSFDYTVVDTNKPYFEKYEPICECFDKESAQLICNALNNHKDVV